jgi:hypothetical protein
MGVNDRLWQCLMTIEDSLSFFTGAIDHTPQIYLLAFSGDRARFLTFTA